MKIHGGVVSAKIRFLDFYEMLLSSIEPENHIGLKVGNKYNFLYHEGLADLEGILNEFSIRYYGTAPEIYFIVTCLKTGRKRKIEIKDLSEITHMDN